MKPKLIIIEGPDCMGKTSLAKFLARRLNAIYWHCTAQGIQNDQPGYLMNVLKNVEQNIEMHECAIVLDRHFPSEICYAPVLRPTKVTHMHEHFAKCIELNALFIFCLPYNPESYLRFMDKYIRGEESMSPEQHRKICDNYQRLVESMLRDDVRVRLYHIEMHGHDLEEYLNNLNL